MIHSMTGYGAAEHEGDGVSYRLEVRSLNNRYLKANIRLPEHLQMFEADVEKLLRERLHRGSVNYTLSLRDGAAEAVPEINVSVLEAYLSQLRGVAGGQASVTLDLAAALQLPGVCQPVELDEPARQRYWAILQRLTEGALDRLIVMRQSEGSAIREDLLAHCKAIEEHAAAVGADAPRIVEEYARRLQQRVNMLLAEAQLELDRDDLMREVAIFAERCDVSEELARLMSHVQQFVAACDAREYVGRKLDFLAQEMLREANTIGSKANDAQISRHVVEIKGLIDRLKEQIQNVE